MKRSKLNEEQIAYALRQAESGTPVGDVCRQFAVSEATFYVWKKKYAHQGVSELRRLRQLEDENNRLKRLVADLTLDKHILTETIRITGKADPAPGAGDLDAGDVPDRRGSRVSAGGALPHVLIAPEHRGRSGRAPAADPRTGHGAARFGYHRILHAVAAGGLAGEQEARAPAC